MIKLYKLLYIFWVGFSLFFISKIISATEVIYGKNLKNITEYKSSRMIKQQTSLHKVNKLSSRTRVNKISYHDSSDVGRINHVEKVQDESNRFKLLNTSFDLNYFGDISGLLDVLHKMDRSILIRPTIGHKFAQEINLDLQNIRIENIADAVEVQTNGKVSLLYNQLENSLSLSFHKTMDIGNDAVIESLKWQSGVNPKPVLKADGVVRFPYGEYQPVIICQPLNLCDIELQVGEEIQGVVIGDSLRWNDGDQGVPIVYSGVTPTLTPHLVLKPSQAGLETSLLVTTSRHTYMFKLKSATTGYIARSGFYYPREMVLRYKNRKNKSSNKLPLIGEISGSRGENNHESRDSDGMVVSKFGKSNDDVAGVASDNADGVQSPLINLGKINYNYVINGDDYLWKPTQVFDDGTSVYIQMPDNIGSNNLPGVCIMIDNDKDHCELVNFRYKDHFYIVDKLFERANLVSGFGSAAQIITIERGSAKKHFWSKWFS